MGPVSELASENCLYWPGFHWPVDYPFSISQKAMHTWAPLLPSSLAVSLPMPMLALVITTIFLGNCMFVLQTPAAKNFLMDRAIT